MSDVPSNSVDITGPAAMAGGAATVLFSTLVLLTKWIGSHYAKEVAELKCEIKASREEHEECQQNHALAMQRVARLEERLGMVDGKES